MPACSRLFNSFAAVLLVFLLALGGCTGDSSPRLGRQSATEDPESLEYLSVSSGASPEVAYALHDDSGDKLDVYIRVEAAGDDWPLPQVDLGLSAAHTVRLDSMEAKVKTEGAYQLFRFTVDPAELDPVNPQLPSLRMAFSVEWLNPLGEVAQKESFMLQGDLPPYAAIGSDPARWQAFSLEEYDRLVANLRQEIRVQWDQPIDGKATVVINDASGKRVRNLVTGATFSSGRQTAIWNGLDEQGNLVAPGEYQWQLVTHPGITPEYKMSYYSPGHPGWRDGPTSMWLGDHSAPEAAVSNGELIALGCALAESGNNIVIVDQEGNKLNDANISSRMGHGRIFLAMDSSRFYAFCEGSPAYTKIRKDETGKEYLYAELSLVAWDLKDGREHRYRNGRETFKVVREYKLDPESPRGKKHAVVHNLRGCVYLNGVLYLSLHDENRILMLDPESGEELGALSLRAPGAVATDGRRLLVYTGGNLALYETPGVGAVPRALFTPDLSAARVDQDADTVGAALALSPEGFIYAADDGVDQNIKVYDLSGTRIRQIGQAGGGSEEGEWIADAVRLPKGLALDGTGQLWVAENHARPKRISVWDAAAGSLKKELFGPSRYGASGAGFDTANMKEWLGGAASWNINIDTGEVAIESVLFSGDKPGMPADRFYPFSAWFLHKDDRTFIVSKDSVMRLYEVMPDNRAKLWAMFGSLHAYEAEFPRWWVPEVFTRHPQLKEILKDFTEPVGSYGNFRNGPAASKDGRELSVMWIDRNGDDVAQVEELQVAGDAGHTMRGSIWGYHFEDTLDWKLWVSLTDGESGIGDLKFKGWLPSGAPDWDWGAAVMGATPVPDAKIERGPQAYLQDRFGRMLINSHPMLGINAEHEVEWTLPNDWNGVHGSQKAPLPVSGVMQGSLSYLGCAPLDEVSDVTVINGNHGRFYVLTTDGIYLDEMFQDVRLSREASAYRIGGEPFGGYFGRDKESGRYILQSGHSDYRIFEIHGLDQVRRQTGQLLVRPEQITAAQKVLEQASVDEKQTRSVMIRTKSDSEPARIAEWGDAGKPFPYVNVTAYREAETLVLRYEVNDPSPWTNQGKDRNLLFKTGDVVVFEFSTDSDARPNRTVPVPGDKKLMIAPYEDGSIALLYDYKVPGVENPVPFNSPWRTAFVDRVDVLEAAAIDVKKNRRGYVLSARIPLSVLGLPPVGSDLELKGDFGVIYGDDKGQINVLRSHWSNQSTGLVNDVPGEIMINPGLWGNFEWK
ncbi:FlgD immunoglobulin-like domain containing protein [Coraliomargarita parva]|uniref:FlgD immunoglobulin-like domain containing protein n=1 Tax=Coraliomargarita parva TaxID=3014050 RepID=UPI0022B356DA|nr:FlgD immunoglobulin-like domain containing protein [Coraliomargarita parva]